MRLCLILLAIALSGCAQPQAKPERSYRVAQRMSPAMKAAVMELVYMKSDPNVFKAKELDPFRKQ